ncbi:MAG: hypothetical protein AMQ74_01419 [Candidatus Methanofastidiosum methylothiophilum]|uniref:Uncharacterized protein n=1 Tax=Candidatus Methanofastidiosum methylothiophilum TaxID=1705564 RepID=A0A150IWW6_9EURY|nr:MAG: hypothetical protein AMQ74_01419 [Candidatus Methanofastidiosum methylthiophilus]
MQRNTDTLRFNDFEIVSIKNNLSLTLYSLSEIGTNNFLCCFKGRALTILIPMTEDKAYFINLWEKLPMKNRPFSCLFNGIFISNNFV